MLRYVKRMLNRRRLETADAADLMSRFGDGAYTEARQRAREERDGKVIEGNRPEGHWDRVRARVGRTTRRDTVDTATRYLS